jgi:tetratricopeptide (TPR) repeat protein
MKIGLWPLAAATGITLAAASPALADCKLNQIFELPVTMVGARPTVTLLVNGQPAKFLVDSGSWTSSIDTTAARALGLKLAKTDEKARGIGGDVDLHFTTIDSLAISKDASLGKVDMLASAGVGENGIAGLIGENVLGFADIEYDLPHGAIRFFKQQGCQGANLGYWADGGGVEIDLTHTGRLPPSRDRDPSHYDPGELDRDVRAVALVNGQKITVTFDTGASTSVLNKSVAARLGVTPDTPGTVFVGLAGGVGPESKGMWVAPFDSFALGAERINKTRLRFEDLNKVQVDMLLGVDFFLSHRIFVANSLSKAYFSYVGGPVFNLDDANRAAQQAKAAPASSSGATDPDALIREASAQYGRRDYAGAIATLDKALAADPKRADAFVLRGRAKLDDGQVKPAKADFDQALTLEPDNFEALLSRGRIRAEDGDLAGARIDLERAAIQNTPDGRARLRVAWAYAGAKAYADAITHYGVIIGQKGADELTAAAYSGRCWDRTLMKQDLDKALDDCNQALKLVPRDPDVLDSRALAHLRRGELDLALADYDAAIKAQPDAAMTLYARAAARLKKGLRAGSDADLAAAKKLNPKVGEIARSEGVVDADFEAGPAAKP